MRKWLLLLQLLTATGFAEDRWIQLRSPYFEILTNAGAGAGRDVLRRFEQIRHVFESRTGRGSLTPLPIRVYVFRNEADFQPYQVNKNAAGYYQAGFQRDYIAMQLTGQDTYRVVYHEYTHLLLRHAGYRVPVWFNEGTAELFSTADVGGSDVRIGGLIPAHVLTLRNEQMLDLPVLTGVDHDSPHYNERGKSGIFYAQSWALIHMLNFAPEYRPGLANFLQMILTGEEPGRCFQQAFGKSPAMVLQNLKTYLHKARFEGVRFRASKFDPAKVPSEAVSSMDAQLALADLLLAIGKTADARALYGQLEAAYPESSAVQVALGQFAFRTDDFPGARRFFERALESGSTDPQLFYDYAMVLRQMKQPEALVVQNLGRAVALNDGFFEAHYFLGYLHLREGRLGEAIRHLERATELQPSRAAVWENLAIAYAKAGDKEMALAAARTGRKTASGPEEAARLDAVLDMIESDADKIVQGPPAPRIQTSDSSPTLSRAEGMLMQVDCLGSQARLHITTSSGKILLLVRDPSAVSGTVINLPCGPAPMRPVIVQYQPETHRTYGTAGVVRMLEFR